MILKHWKLCFIVLAVFQPLVHAEVPTELIEEFFTIENAYPQEKNELQVTTTISHSQEELDATTANRSVEIQFGAMKNLEMDFAIEYEKPSEESAAKNIALEGLYTLINRPGSLSLNVGAGVSLPVDHRDRDSQFNIDPFLAAAWRLEKGELDATIHPSFGSENDLSAGAGYVYPWHMFRGLLELSGSVAEPTLYLTSGVYWHPGGAFEAGVGVSKGLTAGSQHWSVIFKTSFEVKFVKKANP